MRRLIPFIAAAFAVFAAPAFADETRVFDNPRYDGVAVSPCTVLSTNCRQDGPSAYCQTQGYEFAQTWTTRPANRAYAIGQGQTCRRANCQAIQSVTCVRLSATGDSDADAARRDARNNDGRRNLGVTIRTDNEIREAEKRAAEQRREANKRAKEKRRKADKRAEKERREANKRAEKRKKERQKAEKRAEKRAEKQANEAERLRKERRREARRQQEARDAERARLREEERRRAERRARREDRRERRETRSETYETAAGVVFAYPRVNGSIIDHCARWGSNCGRRGANQFCRGQGFAKATDHDTFSTRPTYVIGSGRTCDQKDCRGFRSITCEPNYVAAPPPPPPPPPPIAVPSAETRTYSYPTVSGLAVDHCATFGSNCGRGGAQQLCRSQGFDRAESWETYRAGQTWVLGSNKACTHGDCDGFSSVTCTRGTAVAFPAPPPPPPPAAANTQTFEYPKFQGEAIDHCAEFSRSCGRGGADKFCRSAGFSQAEQWDTYGADRTAILGTGQFCTGFGCRGLATVTCSGSQTYTPAQQPNYIPPPAPTYPSAQPEPAPSSGEIRRFAYPQINGLSVDQCAREGRRCERGGANRYCKSQGFEEALRWKTYNPGATWYIGGERQCSGAQCVGITDLECVR